MRVDPEAVMQFGRLLWQVSDGVEEIRVDVALSAAAAGMNGSDLSEGLQRYSVEQQAIVDALAGELDRFGSQVKTAADEYLRSEDASTGSLKDLGK